jgi:hypothetical protein
VGCSIGVCADGLFARAGEAILSRNYGRGPGQYNVNLRIAKTIGFGRDRGASAGSGAGAAMQAATGRGLGGPIGTPARHTAAI